MSKKQDEEKGGPPALVHDRFQALALGANNLQELLAENLGGGAPTLFQLERIRVASGGVPGFMAGDQISGAIHLDAFEAVVVGSRRERAYWSEPYGGGAGKKPPSCSSQNVKLGFGVGDNGDGKGRHDCATCPQNQWGSRRHPDGSESAGKACKEFMTILVLRQGGENAVLPSVVSVPPSSLKDIEAYLFALTQRRIFVSRALHRFTTDVETFGGFPTTKVSLEYVRQLNDAEVQALIGYSSQVRDAVFASVKQPDQEDAAL